MTRLLCVLFHAAPALAHEPLVSSRGSYELKGNQGAGTLELDATQLTTKLLLVRSREGECEVHIETPREHEHIAGIAWRARCTGPIEEVQLPWLADGQFHLATITQTYVTDERAVRGTARGGAVYSRASLGSGMLELGLRHIALGYDHLLFLFALVLGFARQSRRWLLATLTAFTVGHALSLVLLPWLTLPTRVVETAIAFSIGVSALAVALVSDRSARLAPLLTLPFGVLHGLGFGQGLADKPEARSVLATLLFNCGIELGQIAFVLVALPALAMADTARGFRERGRSSLAWVLVLCSVALAAYRWLLSPAPPAP
jgi:hydrogenase/urease accessory protein HupE